jgi:hypothetical protein
MKKNESFTDNFLITKSNDIIKWTVIALAIIATVYLIYLSILIKDLKYPKAHPYLFTLETLLFSLGTASIIFLMSYGRGTLNIFTVVEFLVVALKFGLVHILLQFSGFYSYVF